ncbi:MAG: hypothetical protein M1835_003610 [Candelina submexicana]|nr:MAG: hypothetical protein M1835_003610 [Candelina submexicana]
MTSLPTSSANSFSRSPWQRLIIADTLYALKDLNVDHSDDLNDCSEDWNFERVEALSRQDNKRHLLLAASGSVATIKLPNIVQTLSECEALSIRILLTQSAENFLAGQSTEQPALDSLRAIANVDDLLVIALLSANSLAKIVGGFSDNLLLSVVRAWDTTGEMESSLNKKRIIVAPAMNTAMWRHPITKRQIKVSEEDWAFRETFWDVLRF